MDLALLLVLTNHSAIHDRDYGFISYCEQCGNSQAFSWDELGQISCLCTNSKVQMLQFF